jgi:hypothetical protein
MNRRTVAAYALGAAGLALCLPATGQAQPAGPTPGSPCGAPAERALSQLPDGTAVQCTGGRWAPYSDPYPSGDLWLSTDTGLQLHGQGMRNPEMLSGPWTGSPLAPDAQCRAEQTAVVSAGEVGAPQVAEGQPGQPLHFEVLPVMFTIELSGDCLWRAG